MFMLTLDFTVTNCHSHTDDVSMMWSMFEDWSLARDTG